MIIILMLGRSIPHPDPPLTGWLAGWWRVGGVVMVRSWEVTLSLNGESKVLSVSEGTSILEAAEQVLAS